MISIEVFGPSEKNIEHVAVFLNTWLLKTSIANMFTTFWFNISLSKNVSF